MAIGLPKDASGAIVPFDTTTMYRENGNQFHVSDLFFEARARKWFARHGSECIETNKLYLDSKKKDSWKKLVNDLHRCVETNNLCAFVSPTLLCDDCLLDSSIKCDGAIAGIIENRIISILGDAK